jgi:hypothetical protein
LWRYDYTTTSFLWDRCWVFRDIRVVSGQGFMPIMG